MDHSTREAGQERRTRFQRCLRCPHIARPAIGMPQVDLYKTQTKHSVKHYLSQRNESYPREPFYLLINCELELSHEFFGLENLFQDLL